MVNLEQRSQTVQGKTEEICTQDFYMVFQGLCPEDRKLSMMAQSSP